MTSKIEKKEVYEFWSAASCGEQLYLKDTNRESFKKHSKIRYELEPFILPFADCASAKGKKVLEIGVGLGADHYLFAEAGASLYGIDLTERAIDFTRRRLDLFGKKSTLAAGDAENLNFPDDYFDIVYSWGVLHHSPNTEKAVNEVFRVLKPGGIAKIMVYNKWSMVGVMLWLRYALLAGKPWRSLRSIYSTHLESPGTSAYTTSEAKLLFKDFKNIYIDTILGHGDLLESNAGQRHRGVLLTLAKKFWPRWFIRIFLPRAGLFMLIEAKK
jgi:ubiquinone/menaquinone biosynthesis C-methylase UbiE